MTSLPVWPQPGTTVTLESGFVITGTGATTSVTDEIRNLLSCHRLLTSDPTEANPNPSPIPPVPGGVAGAAAATISALALMPGVIDGLTCYCQGFRELGDGGEGLFYWDLGSADTADGGTCIAAYGGRWKRKLEKRYFRNVKWFGAYGDDVHDDTEAIQACIDSLGPYAFGCEVFFPYGVYKISDTLFWEGNESLVQPIGASRIRGESGGGKTFPSAQLKWYGPSTHPTYSVAASTYEPLVNGSIMFQLTAFDTIVEGIYFTVAPGHSCGVMVNIGSDLGGPTFAINQLHFANCGFAGGRTLATGTCDYAVVWDYWNNAADGNTEDCRFLDCSFGGFRQAVAWFRSNTQPYGTQFMRCFANNAGMVDPSTPGWDGQEPYGTFIRNDTLSLSLTVQDCDIQRFAAMFYINTHPQMVKVTNCHTEQIKKYWYSGSGSWNDLSNVHFDCGRYSSGAVGLQSYGPGGLSNTEWGPSDVDMFVFRGDHPVTISNCNFQSNYAHTPAYVFCQANDLVSFGNRYTTDVPFRRGRPFESTHVGRTDSRCDTGTNLSGNAFALPTLRGALNPGGTVTISGAATSATVTFSTPEWHEDAFGNPISQSYLVSHSLQTVTGTPTVTAPYISSRLNTGFTISLPSAPGIGNSVTIAYEPYRI